MTPRPMAKCAITCLVPCVLLFVVAAAGPESARAQRSSFSLSDPLRFKMGGDRVRRLSWSPGGDRLAESGQRRIVLWEVDVGESIWTLAGQRDADWSSDGRNLVSEGRDRKIHVWDPDGPVEGRALGVEVPAAPTWSPDGTRIATGAGDVAGRFRILDAQEGRVLQRSRVHYPISEIDWSPDGRDLAFGTVSGMVVLWDVARGRPRAVLHANRAPRDDVNDLAWSPDGAVLATAMGGPGDAPSGPVPDGAVRLWDDASVSPTRTLSGARGWIAGLDWSPDGQWVAAGGEDGILRIWNASSRELVAEQRTGGIPVWEVAWSPHGRRLAAGTGPREGETAEASVLVWELPSGVLDRERIAELRADAEAERREKGGGPEGAETPTGETPRLRPSSTAVFEDDGAFGRVVRVERPYGQLATSFVETDLGRLDISPRDAFRLRCGGFAYEVLLGEYYSDVSRGEWVAFFSIEGLLIVSRNFASAADTSGCEAGDRVFIEHFESGG